jgi:hypothetical protein
LFCNLFPPLEDGLAGVRHLVEPHERQDLHLVPERDR